MLIPRNGAWPAGRSHAVEWVRADGRGAGEYVLPIPNVPMLVGAQLYAQFTWPDACVPGAVSASQALAITVQ